MAVVGMAMNRLSARVLQWNWREGDGMDSSIAADGWNRGGPHAFNRNQVWMTASRVCVDGLQTKQLPETVRDVNRSFAHGVACAVTGLNGRGDLNPIQAILTANGRRGRVAKEFPCRPNLIRRGDYGNAERYRIHGACL